MLLIPFRLTGSRLPVDPQEALLLAERVEHGLAVVPWAEHQRVHTSRGGVVGVLFCLTSRETRARAGLREVLTAAVLATADPAAWQAEL